VRREGRGSRRKEERKERGRAEKGGGSGRRWGRVAAWLLEVIDAPVKGGREGVT